VSNGLTHINLADLISCQQFASTLDLTHFSRSLSHLMGGYASNFRGRGVDFAEVRRYQYGDDIRHMDWRVTARTGKPHTKLYQAERERPVLLAVDMSASMFFGTKVAFKSVAGAKIAATLAWAAVAQGDRVGGLVFADTAHTDIQPATRQHGVLPLLNAISKQSMQMPASTTHSYINTALSRLIQVARPGSLIIIGKINHRP